MDLVKTVQRDRVAPPVGAWIEIWSYAPMDLSKMVAPPVGAWIEICPYHSHSRLIIVAPPVGAWIEIRLDYILMIK